jgi:prevent-host-death family protein
LGFIVTETTIQHVKWVGNIRLWIALFLAIVLIGLIMVRLTVKPKKGRVAQQLLSYCQRISEMTSIPELLPISELRLHQNEVLSKLKDKPVVLTQHSRAAAVLVSVEQWNAREEKLRNAELLVTHYQRLVEMQNDPSSRISHAELKARIAERQESQSESMTER